MMANPLKESRLHLTRRGTVPDASLNLAKMQFSVEKLIGDRWVKLAALTSASASITWAKRRDGDVRVVEAKTGAVLWRRETEAAK